MRLLLIVLLFGTLAGCATSPKLPPLRTVDKVDLPRFMGDWYVIGTIPWFVEKDNVGTMDIYSMRPDGTIDIRYVFHKKTLDAPRQEMKATARVENRKTNAEWSVQFIWPFRAPYLVVYLSPDYRHTAIGYPSRDLLWIMSREPRMSDADFDKIVAELAKQGYDPKRIVRVPQRG